MRSIRLTDVIGLPKPVDYLQAHRWWNFSETGLRGQAFVGRCRKYGWRM